MSPDEQDRFDELVEGVIAALPAGIASLLDEMPVVVLDVPTAEILESVGMDPRDAEAALELCGLHTGTANTDRGLESEMDLPSQIHLFREGIVLLAGGWDAEEASGTISEEIRITLLHEIGHQFGLDEDDLESLGYA